VRNYIKIWLCAEYVDYYINNQFYSTTLEYQIGQTKEECLEAVDSDRNIQLSQNQYQPSGSYYAFRADDPVPRWFEMNKENVASLIDPQTAWFSTDLFVEESPRKTWSRGH